MNIISSEELKSESYQLKIKESLEGLEEEKAAIKNQVFGYLIELGGVREDVFEFLLTNNFNSSRAFANSTDLLCSNADVKWFHLIQQIQDKSNTVYWILEIVRNFNEGVPIEKAESFLQISRTPFEMSRLRVAYLEEHGVSENNSILKSIENVESILEEYLKENEEYKQKIDELSRLLEEKNRQLEDFDTDKLKEELSNKTVEILYYHNLYKEVQLENREKEQMIAEMQQTVNEQKAIILELKNAAKAEIELPAMGSVEELEKTEEAKDEVIVIEKNNSVNDAEEIEEIPMEQPVIDDGSELYQNRILYDTIKKKESESGKRVSFFQELLKIHGKKQFLKLDKERQVTKLLEIMVAKSFHKDRAMCIKKLMDGGMTTEFLYGLIEKDTSAEELEELCMVLLNHETQEINPEEEYEEYEGVEDDDEEIIEDDDDETKYA